MSRPKHPTLYRMFAADGTLLYVGCTIDVIGRFASHRSTQSWWPDVAAITVEHHEDHIAALEAEQHAIDAESPKYNVHGRTGRRLVSAREREAARQEWMAERRAA